MDPEQRNRWYDQDATVSESIELLLTLPPPILALVGDAIVKIIDREWNINEMMASLRTLGADKVLGLHKSKNKRRFYDQNPVLHQAMNYLYLLSMENRLLVANQVIDITNYLFEYLRVCKGVQREPGMDDVAEIVTQYIDFGSDEAKKLLDGIKTRIEKSMNASKRDGSLREDTQGMRIRDNLFP